MTDMTEDNDETPAELPQSEFIDPSPVGDELMRHYAALEPCERIPVAKSFTPQWPNTKRRCSWAC